MLSDVFDTTHPDDKARPTMWNQYRRTGLSEMRPYIPGEDMAGISVSDEDTPTEGDMIARNPANHKDQWLVAEAYFRANFALTKPEGE